MQPEPVPGFFQRAVVDSRHELPLRELAGFGTSSRSITEID